MFFKTYSFEENKESSSILPNLYLIIKAKELLIGPFFITPEVG
jgi:hypothetical protein